MLDQAVFRASCNLECNDKLTLTGMGEYIIIEVNNDAVYLTEAQARSLAENLAARLGSKLTPDDAAVDTRLCSLEDMMADRTSQINRQKVRLNIVMTELVTLFEHLVLLRDDVGTFKSELTKVTAPLEAS